MNQETVNTIIGIVLPIVGALVPIAVLYIDKLGKELQEKNKNDATDKLIQLGTDAVKIAVGSEYQILVEALKKNGTFNEAAQQQAKAEATAAAITIMGTAAKDAITQMYGDFNLWLDKKIEFYVGQSKKQ
jgi:ABC-type Na+ efflux pump permease subunit